MEQYFECRIGFAADESFLRGVELAEDMYYSTGFFRMIENQGENTLTIDSGR